jgi:peroxiredoxin Q/BCP
MGKNQLLTALSLSIALAALPLLHFEFDIAAIFSIFIGFFVALMEFNKHTRLLQFITLYFNAVVFGLALDQFSYDMPYFTVMFLVIISVITIRMHLHRFMLFTRAMWAEPLLIGGAVFLYVLANQNSMAGWLGWAVPVAPLGYAAYSMVNNIITGIQFSKAEKQPYFAEVGAQAPAFMLTDQEGNLVNINQYRGRKHLLVLFVRGDWCPTTHIMMRKYQKSYARLRQKDVAVVAVSPDPMAVNRELVEKLGIEYKVVADEEQEVAKMFGIGLQDNNFAARYAEGVPMPAAFLIDKNGAVSFATRHNRIGEMISTSDIFQIVGAMPQVI